MIPHDTLYEVWNWFASAVDLVLPGGDWTVKAGVAANLLGIAGFILSSAMLIWRFMYRRGNRQVATKGDIDSLGSAVVDTFQERILDHLAAKQLQQISKSDWLSEDQRDTIKHDLKRDLGRIVEEISTDETAAGRRAATGLLRGDTTHAEVYYSDRTRNAAPTEVSDALHYKATLMSLDDPKKAVEACLQAVRVAPNDPLGWSRLAHLYLRIGDAKAAKETFAKAIDAERAGVAV